jgi:hypothetical protein
MPLGNAATSGPGAPGSGYNAIKRWVDINFDLLVIDVPGPNNAPTPIAIPGTGLFMASFPNGPNISEVSISGSEYPHEAVHGAGAILKPHFHIFQVTTGTGTAKLSVEVRVTRGNLTPVYQTVSVLVPMPGVVSFDDSDIVLLDDIDISSVAVEVGTQIAARFYRDPTDVDDTFTGSVGLTTLGLHVPIDSDGSREPGSKL